MLYPKHSVKIQQTNIAIFLMKKKTFTWWRHQMATFSALLALCAGNSPVTGEFTSERPVMWSFDVFYDLRMNKRLSENRDAGDLRRQSAHYDVILMIDKYTIRIWWVSQDTLTKAHLDSRHKSHLWCLHDTRHVTHFFFDNSYLYGKKSFVKRYRHLEQSSWLFS